MSFLGHEMLWSLSSLSHLKALEGILRKKTLSDSMKFSNPPPFAMKRIRNVEFPNFFLYFIVKLADLSFKYFCLPNYLRITGAFITLNLFNIEICLIFLKYKYAQNLKCVKMIICFLRKSVNSSSLFLK